MKMKVLCACLTNTCRSPLVMALAENMFQTHSIDAEVESCGILSAIKPQSLVASARAMSKAALEKHGAKLSSLSPKNISELDIDDFHLIIAVDGLVKTRLIRLGADPQKIMLLNEQHGGLSDPFGGSQEEYDFCVNEINAALPDIMRRISH